MKNFKISDIRWATFDDLELPFWKKSNDNVVLPNNFWQRIWEYPYVALHVPKSGSTIDIGGTYPNILFKYWPKAVSVDIRDLNLLDHPLHKGFWPKEKLIISDARNIPVEDNSFEYAISISAIEEMPNTVDVLKEMVRIAKHRVVVTMDVSEELGINFKLIRELESYLNIKLPCIPHNILISNSKKLKKHGQLPNNEYKHIRVLGIVLDATEDKKDVGIIIPHWESYSFADACLKSILKNKSKYLNQHIYLIDDFSEDGSYEKLKEKYKHSNEITFIQLLRKDKVNNADVGYLLDYTVCNVKEQFVVMLDADTLAINDYWVRFPIWLLEKYNLSSVGLDTGLSSAYSKQSNNENWWQPENGYISRGGIYDNNWFTITNNLYRIMRTATAKVVSENIGFTRSLPIQNGFTKVLDKILNRLKFYNLKSTNRNPYLPMGCDNGVAANHFIDINKMGSKFNLPITSYIGLTKTDGAYGQNICDLLFHFALSTRALSNIRREVNEPGEEFLYWINEIQKNGELNDDLQNEMLNKSRIMKPGGYDNSIPESWYIDELTYIHNLLNDYKKEINE
jgi:hypothetical protein